MGTVVERTLGAKGYSERVRRFRQVAWGVLGYNILVVLWGAYVRASGSGAGCGNHWPLCDGQVIPTHPAFHKMVEYSHRASSGIAMIAIYALCVLAFQVFPKHHRVRKLSAAAAVFVSFEAILGAGLVLFQYVAQNVSVGRAVSSAAHLSNTLLLLGALACTAWFAVTTPIQLRLKEVPWPFWAALPVAILVCITGSIAALGDTLFPAATLAAGVRQDFSPAANFLVRLRMVHPAVAAVAGLLFATVAFFALQASSRPTMRTLSVVVIVSTFVQLCAGLLNLALLAPVWMQILHLFLADVVWIALVLFVAEAAVPIQVRFER